MHYVVTMKFGYPVGITHTFTNEPFNLHVFPNPVSSVCNVTFTLDKPGNTTLSLISPTGQTIATIIDRNFLQGKQTFRFTTSSLEPGLYQLLLQ